MEQICVDDVNADIKLRQVSAVKYFAFLRSAPVGIKMKVLDIYMMSSLLYNSETCADATFDRLEVIYRRMLKSILGLSMTTCSELLYTELCVPSMKIFAVAKHHNLKAVKHYENLIESYPRQPTKC